METWAGLNGDPVAGQAGVWQCDRLIFLATRGPIGDALGTHWGRTGENVTGLLVAWEVSFCEPGV